LTQGHICLNTNYMLLFGVIFADSIPMKNLLYSLFALLLLSGCASRGPQSVDRPVSPNLVQAQDDEDEHRLIIMDPGFQSWFVTNAQPANFYSLQFYEQWNDRYTRAWNELVNQQGMRRSADYPFQEYINYDPRERYGLQLNYELYWYFRYVEAYWGRYYNFPGPGPGRSRGRM
jgi:hypothetical protein